MRPYLVVIFHVRQQYMTEVSLAEHNNVVKALPSDRTDQPFGIVTATAFFHTALTRARGSMFTHFTPADLVAILNIPRLQTLPNSFKILREYRLSVVALVFSR